MKIGIEKTKFYYRSILSQLRLLRHGNSPLHVYRGLMHYLDVVIPLEGLVQRVRLKKLRQDLMQVWKGHYQTAPDGFDLLLHWGLFALRDDFAVREAPVRGDIKVTSGSDVIYSDTTMNVTFPDMSYVSDLPTTTAED